MPRRPQGCAPTTPLAPALRRSPRAGGSPRRPLRSGRRRARGRPVVRAGGAEEAWRSRPPPPRTDTRDAGGRGWEVPQIGLLRRPRRRRRDEVPLHARVDFFPGRPPDQPRPAPLRPASRLPALRRTPGPCLRPRPAHRSRTRPPTPPLDSSPTLRPPDQTRPRTAPVLDLLPGPV